MEVPVIALTSRPFTTIDLTLEQFKKLDLDLTNNGILPNNLQLAPINHSDHPIIVTHGIIFCGLNNKGDVLASIFSLLDKKPPHLIFVDDKLKYVECVERALKQLCIDYIGIHYRACDEQVQNFDVEQAEKELHEFIMQYPETPLIS